MHDQDKLAISTRQAPEGGNDKSSDPLRGTPYRFVRKLSDGAMGEVVEAEQVALRKRVAIKLLRREYAEIDGFVDRMRLEAEALVAIFPHPNVVAVLDLGRAPDGRAYLVMERLVGRTLGEELDARGVLPVDEAVALTRQLLSGLAAAHDLGVVHRDIKPANLFLCDPVRGERVLKILDFGIAKVVGDHAEESRPAPLANPTAQGLMVGTPRFVAPEQAVGLPVDHRADIYSAAVVLYTLLAGRDPFHHHRAIYNLVRAHVSETPAPPSSVAPQRIPEGVERAILKALQKRPGDRWASAAELSEELERAVHPSPQRWLVTEPVDLRSFRAQASAQTALLPAGPGSDAATVMLPVVAAVPLTAAPPVAAPSVAIAVAPPPPSATPHQAVEATFCARSPLELPARRERPARRWRLRRVLSWAVGALFALVASLALARLLALR